VVVVDDASTDRETPAVLERLGVNPRVHIIRHAHGTGNRVADNEGIASARGDLVGTLDADDFCLKPDAVARQVEIFKSDPSVGFVYTAYALCQPDGTPLREYRPFPRDQVRDGPDEFAELALANHVSHSGTMVRRSCHNAVGGYDPGLPYAGDLDLWLRLAGRYRVGYIAEPLYAYRQHAQSMTNRGISPGAAIDEMLAAVHNGFAALPDDAPAELRDLQSLAIERVLLSMTWRERSLGHTRRSWQALLAALGRSPALLTHPGFYGALSRLMLLSAVGHRRYERMAQRRARRRARRRR
jgi:cellulose synthase/poly-beta-1,6-N-acetylglucosamine synthase-like glycosyltransferase